MHLLDILVDLDNPQLFPEGLVEPTDVPTDKDVIIGTLEDERSKLPYTLYQHNIKGKEAALSEIDRAAQDAKDVRTAADAYNL